MKENKKEQYIDRNDLVELNSWLKKINFDKILFNH